LNVSVKLYQSQAHTCGYYRDRVATNIIVDPAEPALPRLYQGLLSNGFRRAGGIVYRPKCVQCQACIPTRIPTTEFRLNRQQRRTLAKNADVSVSMVSAEDATASDKIDEKTALYQRYIGDRHSGGGMDDPSEEDFRRFLLCDWATVFMLELRLNGQLIGCAVTDVTVDAASAVYTFYDPAYAQRSLGVFSVLQQIDFCQRTQLRHLYLGYWIENHPKMDYKRVFQPIEYYRNTEWQRGHKVIRPAILPI